jgi:hypothetical protein
MEKKSYIEPQIVDYGSIAEMTSGRGFRKKADVTIFTGENVEHETTGPCYSGYHVVGKSCVL